MDLKNDCGLTYRESQLHMEDASLGEIASSVGTPVYCYSVEVIEKNFRRLQRAFDPASPKFCFAIKANSNLAIIRLLANLGAGAEVVSEGELRRAVASGMKPGRIVFAGVGKSESEIAFALETGIYQFNVESEAELDSIASIAEGMALRAPVALRVNPDVEAKTNAKITTGTSLDKFGIPIGRVRQLYVRALDVPSLEVVGISVHIGSQLTDLEPFRTAYGAVVDLARDLQNAGYPVRRLDLGGGLGVTYRDEEPPTFEAYAEMVRQATAGIDCELILEPGRSLVANAGVLLCQVVLNKTQESRRFVVVDAAINDLLRPGLYEARHSVFPVREARSDARYQPVDFVGPVCETSDTFCRDEQAPPLNAGDYVVMLSAGAYGAVMASTYNSRPLVPEVLIRGNEFELVRRRESYDELLSRDRVPTWLTE